MKSYIRMLIILIVILASLIIFNNFNLTGNIIWGDINVGNCSNDSIKIFWDSIFNESNNDIIILKEFEENGNCNRYSAYKNNSDGELWALSQSFYNNSWTYSPLIDNLNDKYLSNYFSGSFFYINTTNDALAGFNEIDNITEQITLLTFIATDFGSIFNWSLTTALELNNTLINLYKFDSISGEDFVDYLDDYFKFEETRDNYLNHSIFSVAFHKNESFSMGFYDLEYYYPFFMETLGNITNYEFETNINWTFAFDLNEYFNVSDDVSIEFESTGVGNENSELINYTINESGVFFMPAADYNGSLEFKLIASVPVSEDIYYNISSNNFLVTITAPNSGPTLIKNFENINISYGENISLILGDYFKDPDYNNLTYSVSKVGGVNFSLKDDILTVFLNDDFGIYAKLMITASNGVRVRASNWFYVYENVSIENLEVNIEDTELVESETFPNEDDGVNDNSSGKSNINWARWFVWIIIIIVVLAIIMFIIWFLILRKTNEPVTSTTPMVPVINPPNTFVKDASS